MLNTQILSKALEAFSNFVMIDSDCKIIFLNKIYADLLGIRQEDAIGKSVTDVIPGTKLPEIVKTGRSDIGTFMPLFDHRVNKEVEFVCNRIPLKDGDKIVGALAITTFNETSEVFRLSEELNRIRAKNEAYKEELHALKKRFCPLTTIIGSSEEITEVKKIIKDFAKSHLTILLTGETGVGKEVFSNAIHEMSNRSGKPFIKLNCSAIPSELLESELFGYEAGAFTGAKEKGKIGKFEQADGGTILLDEIGEMPLALQSKLLRVLQEQEVERIGGTGPKKIDVRVLCSTNRDLKKMVQNGAFRADFYYRINTVEIEIPPLRSRLEDIDALTEYFIDHTNQEAGIHTKGIHPQVLQLFKAYSWPGNVRELKHVVERLSYLCQNSMITMDKCAFFQRMLTNEWNEMQLQNPQPMPDTVTRSDTPAPVKFSMRTYKEHAEKQAILDALAKTGGNKSKAAALLGMGRSAFYNKLHKYNI